MGTAVKKAVKGKTAPVAAKKTAPAAKSSKKK